MASRHAESLRTAAREARYSPLGQRAGAPARQRMLIVPSSLGLPALPDIRRKESSAASALAEAVKAEAVVEAAATTAEAAAAAAEAMVANAAEAEIVSGSAAPSMLTAPRVSETLTPTLTLAHHSWPTPHPHPHPNPSPS